MVQDRVIGILDWELSTLGNQMCDVAYSCLVLTIFRLHLIGMERDVFCTLFTY
jgi:aminoglycoside phosphotransferase (APT) family kinase protein